MLAADCCAKTGRPACCSEVETAPTALTEKSLYQLDSTWTNDSGAAISLASLKGRPQVVAMFFANCAYTCPLLVHNMKQIEAALPENLRTNVGFVLVSFDSERDTPAALHDYRVQHQLDSRGWTLLHGNPDDILEFAALLGVKFKKDAQGQFMHSNVITFLNSEGEIAFQETGLNVSPADVVDKLVREGDRSH
jgi:protein SCO1/2